MWTHHNRSSISKIGSQITYSYVLICISSLLVFNSSIAQTTLYIDAKEVNSEYMLEVVHVGSIGLDTEISPITLFSKIKQDGRGLIYVAHTKNPYEIAVFSESFEFIGSLGQNGGGPGEFRRIDKITFGTNDTLYAVDTRNARVSVFWDSEFIRTFPLNIYPTHILASSFFVVGATVPTPDRVGIPLHILDYRGEILHSFGSISSEYRYDRPWNQYRTLALCSPETFWAGHYNRYQIELWSIDAELRKILIREADWFKPWEEKEEGDPFTSPPKSHMSAINQDKFGRLWTLSRVRGEGWERLDITSGPGNFPEISQINKMYDTVVEVIDTESGTLLISEVLPRNRAEFIGEGLISEIAEREDGETFLRIWQLTMKRR